MDWKLHIILSLILYFVIVSFFPFPLSYSIPALLLLIFSSLFPDLDHPKSLVRKVVFILTFYFLAIYIFLEMPVDFGIKILTLSIISILSLYVYKNLPLRHRGKRSLHLWRYCPAFAGCFTVLFALANINISFTLFIIVGYASHLIADGIREV